MPFNAENCYFGHKFNARYDDKEKPFQSVFNANHFSHAQNMLSCEIVSIRGFKEYTLLVPATHFCIKGRHLSK